MKDKKNNTDESTPVRDELADALAASLNKNSDGKVAFFLDAEDDPSQIVDWVSTGNSLVDLAIANRANAGLPVGRITELTGLEASGKSLMGAHLLAETQRKGGLAIFIDTESSVDRPFLIAIGVDTDKMMYLALDTLHLYVNPTKIVWSQFLLILLPQLLPRRKWQVITARTDMQLVKLLLSVKRCEKSPD
jgi:hypothetical protein